VTLSSNPINTQQLPSPRSFSQNQFFFKKSQNVSYLKFHNSQTLIPKKFSLFSIISYQWKKSLLPKVLDSDSTRPMKKSFVSTSRRNSPEIYLLATIISLSSTSTNSSHGTFPVCHLLLYLWFHSEFQLDD